MWPNAVARLDLQMPPSLPPPARGVCCSPAGVGLEGQGPNSQWEYKLLWL